MPGDSVNPENVKREEWIVGGLAVLLAFFLVILPWFSSSGYTFTATDYPDGWLGIVAVIACLALLTDLVVELVSPQTEIPAIGNRTNTRFILACLAAFFVVLKFLFHVHFSLFGWGFYIDVIVTAALVYFALQVRVPAPLTVTRPARPGHTAGPGAAGPQRDAAEAPDVGQAPGAGAAPVTGPAPGAPLPPESRSGPAPPPGG